MVHVLLLNMCVSAWPSAKANPPAPPWYEAGRSFQVGGLHCVMSEWGSTCKMPSLMLSACSSHVTKRTAGVGMLFAFRNCLNVLKVLLTRLVSLGLLAP